jgi:hypothetical protein
VAPKPPGRFELKYKKYKLRASLEISGVKSMNGELTTGPRLVGTGSLDALEESARNREPDLLWKLAYGHFEQLRGEARFDALLGRVGIVGRPR